MICPDCGHDNIEGVDSCEECGQSMVVTDDAGNSLAEVISRHKVSVICEKAPITVESGVNVRAAIKLMVENRIGCLLVMNGDDLVGVFTERDVLNRVSSDLRQLDRPVAGFMTPTPETVTRDDSIAYALHCMDLGGYRHLPMVDSDSRPVGIISSRDVMRFLCVRFAEIRSG